MTSDEIGRKRIEMGLGVPDTSEFAEKQRQLDAFCAEVSGDGLAPATGLGAQFNPQKEQTVSDLAILVGCTEEEMIRFMQEK